MRFDKVFDSGWSIDSKWVAYFAMFDTNSNLLLLGIGKVDDMNDFLVLQHQRFGATKFASSSEEQQLFFFQFEDFGAEVDEILGWWFAWNGDKVCYFFVVSQVDLYVLLRIDGLLRVHAYRLSLSVKSIN